MIVEWLPSVVSVMYENRETALSQWDRLITMVLGPKSRIAFVGPGGVGKTVLLDYITGVGKRFDYVPQPRSTRMDEGNVRALNERMGVVTVPGQKERYQDEAFDRIFDPDAPVDGVVFVAGNGFQSLREEAEVLSRQREGIDLAALRQMQLQEELSFLEGVLERIRQAKIHSRSPKWMLVVPAKCDLYFSDDQLLSAKEYYGPGFGGRI